MYPPQINYDSVRIPHPGNSLAGGSIADLAGDSDPPDITGLDVDAENGIVNIVVTYNQNVKPDNLSYGEDLTGWILIDADQNLATGFTNTEQAPPTFGIDYRIEYAVGKSIGTDASITKIDHESDLTKSGITQTMGVLLGVPYNDATFKVVANQVFLGIPLGLLGHTDGNMDVTIDSFTVFGLLDGDIDSAPDFGDGALDTGFISIGSHQITGDLDLDGTITSVDARVALEIAAIGEWNPVTDMNGDNRVTSIDTLMILQIATVLQTLVKVKI